MRRILTSTFLLALLLSGCMKKHGAPALATMAHPNIQLLSNPVTVAEMDTYAKQVDSLADIDSNRLRYFADTTPNDSGAKPLWKGFRNSKERSDDNDGNMANMYFDASKNVLAAYFTFQSGSGDWVHYISMYYRSNGTPRKGQRRTADLLREYGCNS